MKTLSYARTLLHVTIFVQLVTQYLLLRVAWSVIYSCVLYFIRCPILVLEIVATSTIWVICKHPNACLPPVYSTKTFIELLPINCIVGQARENGHFSAAHLKWSSLVLNIAKII